MGNSRAIALLLGAAVLAACAAPWDAGALSLSPKTGALALRLRLRGATGPYALQALPDAFGRATVTLASATALAQPLVLQTTSTSFSYPYTTLNLSAPPLRPASDYTLRVDLETTTAGDPFLEATGTVVAQTLSPGANTVDVLLSVPAVSTLAGRAPNGDGTFNGTAAGARDAAQFDQPEGVARDAAGNFLVVEEVNQRIAKVTPAGTVSVLTANGGLNGYVNGASGTARFRAPHGLAIDPVGGTLFVGDWQNAAVRQVNPSTGAVSTAVGAAPTGSPNPGTPTGGYAEGAGTAARLGARGPVGLTCDGTYVYFVDYDNACVRKFDLATKTTSLVTGVPGGSGYADGAKGTSKFSTSLIGIAHDGKGNLYVLDSGNAALRRVRISDGYTTTVAGNPPASPLPGSADGSGTASRITGPRHIAVHPVTGDVYFTEGGVGALRRYNLATGYVQTLVGGNARAAESYADGTARRAEVSYLGGLAFSPDGQTLTFADRHNHCLRQYAFESRVVTTLAGAGTVSGSATGTGLAARFNEPCGLLCEPGGSLVIADYQNHCLRRYNAGTQAVTTFAGTPGTAGNSAALLNRPVGLARDGAGAFYVAEWGSGAVRKVSSAGAVGVLAGVYGTPGFADGAAASAKFGNCHDVAVNAAGTIVYVADTGNHRVRKIQGGSVSTIAGNGTAGEVDGPPASSQLNGPCSLALDEAAGVLYVLERTNGVVRKLTLSTNALSTIAGGTPGYAEGTGAGARFFDPQNLRLGPDGHLYLTDRNNRIRRVNPATGEATTYAGGGTSSTDAGFIGGAAASSRMNWPHGLAFAADGTLYFTDRGNHVLRKIQ